MPVERVKMGARTRLGPVICVLLALQLSGSPTTAQLGPPADDSVDALYKTQTALERLIEAVGPSVVAVEAQPAPGRGAAAGSGCVIRADGMILTSEHLLTAAMTIHVTLHDGRRCRARRVAADSRRDLAVVQIDAKDLTPVEFGDSGELRRGAIVLAFGNPLGLAHDGKAAATLGLISGMSRPLPASFGQDEDRYYGDMIQTTAPIVPGYSGGPLVEIGGRVVGVITAAADRIPTADGLGFAVPISASTRSVIDILLSGREIEYGYLGVQVRDAGRPSVFSSDAPHMIREANGAALQFIYPNGPADRAGLQAGDVVTGIDDVNIASADQLVQVVGAAGPDKVVRVAVHREAKRRDYHVKLGHRGFAMLPTRRERLKPSGTPLVFRGATLVQADPALREKTSAQEGALLVQRVDAGSAADRAGLTPGDVVVRIDGQSVTPDSAETLSNLSEDSLLGLANGGSVLVKAMP